MGKVHSILNVKSKTIFSVNPSTIVYDALKLMLEKNVSALLVTENEQLMGIFTERDYARKVALQGKSSRELEIREIMTGGKLITVTMDTSIDECMQLMTNNFIRHLPVLHGDKLTGIISIGDVVKYIIEEQKFIIKNLEHYITGS